MAIEVCKIKCEGLRLHCIVIVVNYLLYNVPTPMNEQNMQL